MYKREDFFAQQFDDDKYWYLGVKIKSRHLIVNLLRRIFNIKKLYVIKTKRYETKEGVERMFDVAVDEFNKRPFYINKI